MNPNENLYSVLNCHPNSTYDELKTSYQSLVREFHPDKSKNIDHKTFLAIDKAWKVLRNQTTRSEYDKLSLEQSLNDSVLVHATIQKNEISFENCDTFTYPCRCGGCFRIEKCYLDEEECTVECEECTNCILIV